MNLKVLKILAMLFLVISETMNGQYLVLNYYNGYKKYYAINSIDSTLFYTTNYPQTLRVFYKNGIDELIHINLVENINFQNSIESTVEYGNKTYHTVHIGSQIWLKENLDVGAMILSSAIPHDNSIIEKYCYNNELLNCSLYGGLYQWNEAMNYSLVPGAKGICPDGWHIPTYEEYSILLTYTTNSEKSLVEQANNNGFNALLSGYLQNDYTFLRIGFDAQLWSSSERNNTLSYHLFITSQLSSLTSNDKHFGFNIRCLKD